MPKSELIEQVTRPVVTVVSLPDEVQIRVTANEGVLTIEQARALAPMILAAADEAERLDWEDGPDGDLVMVDRNPE